MKTLYRTCFWVQVDGSLEEVLRQLRVEAGGWLQSRRRLAQDLDVAGIISSKEGRWTPYEGAELTVSTTPDGAISIFVLEPDSRQPLSWHAIVRLTPGEERIRVEVSVRCSGTSGALTAIKGKTGTPRIVPRIVSAFSCYVGPLKLHTTPQTLSASEMDGFVAGVLTYDERRLPVILVAPDNVTGLPIPDLNLERLSEWLAGLAHVFVLRGPTAAWELTGLLGKERSCFHGAARVYWPGFRSTSPPYEHRLFLPRVIERTARNYPREGFSRYLYDIIVETAVLALPDPFFDLTAKLHSDRERLLLDLRQAAVEHASDEKEKTRLRLEYDELQELLELADGENKELRALREELRQTRDDLRRAEAEKDQFEQQFIDVTVDLGKVQARNKELEGIVAESQFDSVADVLEQVLLEHDDRILCHPHARTTAKGCTFEDLPRLHDALVSLKVVWLRLAEEGQGELEAAYERETGIGYAPTLKDTESMSRFQGRYSVQVKRGDGIPWPKDYRPGQRVWFDRHLQLGRAKDHRLTARIYFHYLPRVQKVLLLHVGGHPRSGAT